MRLNINRPTTINGADHSDAKRLMKERFQGVLDLRPPPSLFEWTSVSKLSMMELEASMKTIVKEREHPNFRVSDALRQFRTIDNKKLI